MKTFFSVLKNDYLRVLPRWTTVGIFTLFTLATMLFAVYLTEVQHFNAHIAYIPQGSSMSAPQSSPSLTVNVLEEVPPRSALMQQQYDAYVTPGPGGTYTVETLKNQDFKQLLTLLLKNPNADLSALQPGRGVGVNILGFMMMFALTLAAFNLFVFADDKEQGQLKRISAAPVSFGFYLTAHCVYCLSMMLPEYLLLVVLKLLGWDIGFSLPQYAGLLSILVLFGISLSLLLNTLIKKPDNANMLGSAIIILTSILSGSFYSLKEENTVLDGMVNLLPQKQLLDFATALQSGNTAGHTSSLLYFTTITFVILVSAVVLLHKKYVKQV
ncbi:MAG: linearmycin/streptolysin transport system permease protein [Clostridiales bacterium]|jgi:ABC-2 type transport system permease protein|nr:linearmycin/streptolysin transport system permease protein [Clostridiales bacterium]